MHIILEKIIFEPFRILRVMYTPYNLNFVISFLLSIFVLVQSAGASMVWMNFDELPVTAENEIPGSNQEWLYTTAEQNPDNSYPMTVYDMAGWRCTASYPDDPGVYDFFRLYPNYYYSDSMGWPTYGYLEIDGRHAVKGNSLRYRVSGGVNSLLCPCGEDEECSNGDTSPCLSNGLEVTTKQHYLDYIAAGRNPVEGGTNIGSPDIYFMNTGPNGGPNAVPFTHAQGNNRLSLYVYLPKEKDNDPENPIAARETPATTIDIGPFNDVGGHWYHRYNLQGGGWMRLIVDAHPQHNNAFSNASSYPYPSRSVRDMGYDYFSTMYRWYFVVVNPYGQTAEAPYSVWLDEIEFYNDTEPQNNETINSPAVGYYPDRGVFEIGFRDKYANNQYSYSTYQVKYSFSQITNDTWDQAAPVHIQADDRISYGISENDQGIFEKINSYSRSVWAPFKLSAQDEALLTSGTTIYFAIKDISQHSDDTQIPVDGHNIYGNWKTGAGGRDYLNHGDSFDYAGDAPALNLIKRIDYTMPIGLVPGDCDRDGDVDGLDLALFGANQSLASLPDFARYHGSHKK